MSDFSSKVTVYLPLSSAKLSKRGGSIYDNIKRNTVYAIKFFADNVSYIKIQNGIIKISQKEIALNHLENFKNIKGIAEAKSEIIENIQADGIIILNRDDKFYKFLFKKANLYNLKTSSFGRHKDSDIRLVKTFRKKNSVRVTIKMNNRFLDLEIRDLNIHNVLAALAILSFLKVDITNLVEKFKSIESSLGRGKKYSISRYKKKFKLIDESYNANPLSVKNAIKNLSFIKKEKFKKYLILGDMLELGSKSKKYHTNTTSFTRIPKRIKKVVNTTPIPVNKHHCVQQNKKYPSRHAPVLWTVAGAP